MNSRTTLLIALPASICAALPAFFSRERIYNSVAGAFDATSGDTSLFNQALGTAWRLGGIQGAETLVFLLTFLPWMTLFTGVALATRFLTPTNASRLNITAMLGTFVLGAHGLVETVHAIRTDVRSPELAGPVRLAAEALAGGGRVLLDPRTRAFGQMFDFQAKDVSVTLDALPKILQSPLAWRTAHRESPFSTVALSYPFDLSKPLFESLSTSPDWTLTTIDNQGVIFRPTATRMALPAAETARDLFQSPRDQAIWLSQAALVLQSTGQSAPAVDLMAEALALTPDDPLVLTKAAALSAAHGKWQRAKSEAGEALAANPRSVSARYLLALSWMKTGALDKALDESAALVASAPNDAASHLLRARIAEAANDPATEAASLERLLDITRSQNQPTDGIQILLGQAWARAGFPRQALENHRAALSGDISPEHRKLIEETIELIESRALSGH